MRQTLAAIALVALLAPPSHAQEFHGPVVHVLAGRADVVNRFDGRVTTSSLSVLARGSASGTSPDRFLWVSSVENEGAAEGQYTYAADSGLSITCELNGWFYEPNWWCGSAAG